VFPFEVELPELEGRLDEFVGVFFATLESEFLALPKGDGFVECETFEAGYDALKKATTSFSRLEPELILPVVHACPISLVVLRAILGFSPPEWAYMASRKADVQTEQGVARNLDRKIRLNPTRPIPDNRALRLSVSALVQVACELIRAGAPAVPPDKLHRPLAGHRDSVSELVGDSLEVRIEEALTAAGIGFRKTKRAERVSGFDQAPDFIAPDEFNPKVVIEAKITEDDGTARDKVTRVQHLDSLRDRRVRGGQPAYEVVACIGGRGFGIRREDMRKLLLATQGKVFTPKTLDRLIHFTRLRELATNTPSPPKPQA
jgi:hypothetical protein